MKNRPLIKSNQINSKRISTSLGNNSREILPNTQFLQPHFIFQREAFLVC